MKKLSKNEEAFAQNVADGKTLVQAYFDAYPNFKGTQKTAYNKGYQKSKKGEIRARIEELKSQVVEKHIDSKEQMRQFIIDQYKAIADADIGNFYNIDIDEEGNFTLNIKDLSQIDTRAIQEISFVSGNKVKLKLYSKTDAITQLSKLYGIEDTGADNEIKVTIAGSLEGMAD